ncbi:MAG: hypothetical protein K0S34_144 [Bacillales bacterium]|jgi:uncharacterized protein YggE|nr:hypothetical protein [Bacillales bacterium]
MNRYIFPNNPIQNINNVGSKKKIIVSGEGSITSVPDKAEIVLGIVTEDQNIEEAQKKNSLITNEVVNIIQYEGIKKEDLVTTSYNITPQYDYKEGQSIFRGYQVVHMFRVTVDNLNKIGTLINATTSAGLNRVDSITFGVSNKDDLYKMALTNAVLNSKEKAQIIANSLNVNINMVPESVREITSSPVQPLLYNAEAFVAKNVASPVQPGSLTVQAEVVSEFIIE